MFEELQKEITLVKILLILLTIATGLYIFSVTWDFLAGFSDIFVTIIAAWLLSFILEPIANAIARVLHMPKTWASLITILLVLTLVGVIVVLFVPIVTSQLQSFATAAPTYFASSPKFLDKFNDSITAALNNSVTYIPSVANFFLSFFIAMVIAFYLIVDKERISNEVLDLFPDKWHDQIKSMQELIDTTFASFLRVQLVISILSGLTTWVVLELMDIPFAAFIGLLSGLLTFIPLIGGFFALIPPLLVALPVDPTRALIILAVLMLAQQILFNVFAPKFLGNAFKMHPIVVLISTIIGFRIAGGIGGIFAIPILSVSIVVVRELNRTFFKHKK